MKIQLFDDAFRTYVGDQILKAEVHTKIIDRDYIHLVAITGSDEEPNGFELSDKDQYQFDSEYNITIKHDIHPVFNCNAELVEIKHEHYMDGVLTPVDKTWDTRHTIWVFAINEVLDNPASKLIASNTIQPHPGTFIELMGVHA